MLVLDREYSLLKQVPEIWILPNDALFSRFRVYARYLGLQLLHPLDLLERTRHLRRGINARVAGKTRRMESRSVGQQGDMARGRAGCSIQSRHGHSADCRDHRLYGVHIIYVSVHASTWRIQT